MFNDIWSVINNLRIEADTKVLDIGGSAEPFDFGLVTIIDLAERPSNFEGDYIKLDITRDRLPFADKSFDVCICSHTLEDVSNPTLCLDEMMRVCKRGYIETPSRGLEVCFFDYEKGYRYPGWGHHRWIFEEKSKNSFSVIQKCWYLLHSDTKKVKSFGGKRFFEFYWDDKFVYELKDIVTNDDWLWLIEDHNRFVNKNKECIPFKNFDKGE